MRREDPARPATRRRRAPTAPPPWPGLHVPPIFCANGAGRGDRVAASIATHRRKRMESCAPIATVPVDTLIPACRYPMFAPAVTMPRGRMRCARSAPLPPPSAARTAGAATRRPAVDGSVTRWPARRIGRFLRVWPGCAWWAAEAATGWMPRCRSVTAPVMPYRVVPAGEPSGCGWRGWLPGTSRCGGRAAASGGSMTQRAAGGIERCPRDRARGWNFRTWIGRAPPGCVSG